jgi:O-antigen ligase
MAVGAMTTVTLTRLHGGLRAGALLVGVAAGAAAATLLPATIVQPLLDRRVTLDSLGRIESARGALGMIAARPLTGVGPGQALFPWTTVDGHAVVQRYAHNEYLEILVELGAVGLMLLLVLLVAIAITVRRGRDRAELPHIWLGALAALIALAIHSGFDFLWQLPVIPLCAGLVAGLAAPGPQPPGPAPAGPAVIADFVNNTGAVNTDEDAQTEGGVNTEGSTDSGTDRATMARGIT